MEGKKQQLATLLFQTPGSDDTATRPRAIQELEEEVRDPDSIEAASSREVEGDAIEAMQRAREENDRHEKDGVRQRKAREPKFWVEVPPMPAWCHDLKVR